MMKPTLLLSILLIWLGPLAAQYEPAVYDYALNYFNNGQALPSEQNLLISGDIGSDIQRVEVSVLKGGSKNDHLPLYTATWKRVPQSQQESFRLPFNYKLHGNSKYDFLIAYYRKTREGEKATLRKLLKEACLAYLSQQIRLDGGRIDLQRNPRGMLSDLNALVEKALTSYCTANEVAFQGFSEVVLQGIWALPRESGSSIEEERVLLWKQLSVELDPLLNSELLVRSDLRVIRAYPTEKVRGSLALNLGYGGVYLSGEAESFSYGNGFYLGLSLPLGSRVFASPLLSNASLSVGAFLNNFEREDGSELSGPLFGRPYFVGLGYRLFRFVRLNAGMTLLEERTPNAGGGLEVEGIQLQPFVGLSAEINISLGLKEKK